MKSRVQRKSRKKISRKNFHKIQKGGMTIDPQILNGTYSVKFSLKPNPTEEERFEIGNFSTCDSGTKIPNSTLLFEAFGNFKITLI
jgi:hypothetical protein